MADEAAYATPPRDPAAVRETADALLDERRYRDAMGLGTDDRTRGFFEHLEARLAALMDAIANLREAQPFLYWTLVIGLGVVAALLIAHIIYTVRKGSQAPAPTGPTIGEVIREQTLSTLQAQVAEAEAAGDLALALRLRFALAAATVLGLPRLRTLGHLTYRELAAAVGGGGSTPPLDEVVAAVEDTYYGGQAMTEERYRGCLERLERGAR